MKKIIKTLSIFLLTILTIVFLGIVILFSFYSKEVHFYFKEIALPQFTSNDTVHMVIENICNSEDPLINDRRHREYRKKVSFTEFEDFQKNLPFCKTGISSVKYNDISMLSTENHIVADIQIIDNIRKEYRIGVVLTSRHAQPYTWSIGGVFSELNKDANIFKMYNDSVF